MTPRATFSKWLITDSCSSQPPISRGSSSCTSGLPISTSRKQVKAPRMKAVIWLRVIAEAQIPIAIICAVRSAAPTYWAKMIPASASDTRRIPSAMGRVPTKVISTKTQLPRNLPSTTSVSPSG